MKEMQALTQAIQTEHDVYQRARNVLTRQGDVTPAQLGELLTALNSMVIALHACMLSMGAAIQALERQGAQRNQRDLL